MSTQTIQIKNNATNEVREYKEESNVSRYQYSEGNYSCDCNREYFFKNVGNEDVELEDCKCSENKYSVNVFNEDKTIEIYKEF